MGKRNRRRRRPGENRGRTTPRPGPRRSAFDDHVFDHRGDHGLAAGQGFAFLAEALAHEDHARADLIVDAIGGRWHRGVSEAASASLRAATSVAWERGWQPADLVHAVGRKLAAPERRLLVAAVTAEAATWRAHPAADAGWIDQIDDLEADLPAGAGAAQPAGLFAVADAESAEPAGPAAGPSPGFVAGWAAAEALDTLDALVRSATLVGLLWRLPTLPPIGDPPSAWGARAAGRAPARDTRRAPAGVDERILNRIRALVAKAESTEFTPEAEALMAKAQELSARYSIDQALLSCDRSGGAGGGEVPRSRRVLIHDPYAKGKSYLLAQVAVANRCQAVWSKELGFSTVFGFATDLAVTDILYTSLVSQCSAAMVVASRGVTSPRSFRDSFVVSFAIHIGERLAEATKATVEEARATHGDSLLPVLAVRDEAVGEARDQAFPHLRPNRMRISDERGWSAGQAAAELARLEVGRAVGS